MDASGYASFLEANFPNGSNPTLVPNTDPGFAADQFGQEGGVINNLSQSDYLNINPRTYASGAISLTGTITTGDTVALAITNPIFPSSKFYASAFIVSTLVSAVDTLASVAIRLTNLINSNSTLKSFGIYATYGADGSSNPQVSLFWPGPIGAMCNLIAFSCVQKSTLTIAGTATTGDTLTLTLAGNLGLQSQQLTLGGTASTGDVITMVVSSPALPANVTLTYTVPTSSTLATVATALAALISSAASTSLAPVSPTVSAQGSLLSVNFASSCNVTLNAAATRTAGTTIAFSNNTAANSGLLQPAPTPSELITIGGTPATGELIAINYNSQGGGNGYFFYTVLAGDTTTTIAAALAAEIDASPYFAATSTGPAISVTWGIHYGFVGFTGGVYGIATETFTKSTPTTANAGFVPEGSISVSLPFTVPTSSTTSTIATAIAALVNGNAILNRNVLAVASTNTVLLYSNGSVGPVSFTTALSASATETMAIASNNSAQTVTVSGTVTAGDALTATLTINGTATAATYTAVAGDTNTTEAAGLVAAINNLALGVTASNAAGVITLNYPAELGSVALSTSKSVGATETIASGGSPSGGETFIGSGVLTGGAGPIIPTQNFTFWNGAQPLQLWNGKPVLLDYTTLSAMVSQQMPII